MLFCIRVKGHTCPGQSLSQMRSLPPPPHWLTVLLTGAWRLLVALTLQVLDDELRGLLLRILLARRLQVFLYWCRSREYTNGSLAALL